MATSQQITHHPPLRVVFAGTPDFAVPTLEALIASGQQICAVYTQPDRPAGRGRRLTPSPVKCAAGELPVRQPASLRDRDTQAALAALEADLLVVVAYGLLLPRAVLAMPRLGCINVHASLLPRWRGAAPIQRALLAGDAETGISIMRMEAGLDTGPVYSRASLPIDAGMTAGQLHDALASLGATTLINTLPEIIAGTPPQAQDDCLACYADKLDKAEAWLDWQQGAVLLERQVRAFNPWPVAQTRLRGQILRIWRARALMGVANASPGTILRQDPQGIEVATGDGILRLLEVQAPGKRAISAADFARTRALSGERLGEC